MGYFLSLSKETTEHWLNAAELMLLVCGLVLAYGAAGEYLEEHGKLPRSMRWAREPKLVFVWMVAISLFGEFAGDAGVYIFSGQLQTISDTELTQLKNENLKLQGQVGDTAEKLRLANDRFAAIDKRAGALDTRMDGASTKLDTLEGRLAWRTVTPQQYKAWSELLVPFAKSRVVIVVYENSEAEAKSFGHDLVHLFHDGGKWDAVFNDSNVSVPLPEGIICQLKKDKADTPAGKAFRTVMSKFPGAQIVLEDLTGYPGIGTIRVGMRRTP
jgi:hypothetical protein